jgi:hypothetical protein
MTEPIVSIASPAVAAPEDALVSPDIALVSPDITDIHLTASDAFEIAQNQMRIGVCVAMDRYCYCPDCVKERCTVAWPEPKPRAQRILVPDKDHVQDFRFAPKNSHHSPMDMQKHRAQMADNYAQQREKDAKFNKPYQVRSIPVGYRCTRDEETAPALAASAGHGFVINGAAFVYDKRFDDIPWTPCGIPEFIDDQIVGNLLTWLFHGKSFQNCISLLPLSVTSEPDGAKPRWIDLSDWTYGQKKSETDPNLRYKQRYALDRMHWSKHYIRGKNDHYGDGVSRPNRPRNADQFLKRETLPRWNEDPFDNICWQCGEAHGSCDDFMTLPYMEPSPRYPRILCMVSNPPRQSLYGGNNDRGASASSNNIWTGRPEDWTAGHGLLFPLVISYNIDRRIRASAVYRPDPEVTHEIERKVEQALKEAFEKDTVMDDEGKIRPRLKYYPDDSFTDKREIFHTVRETYGAEDEMLFEQQAKLAQVKSAIKRTALLDAVERVLQGTLTHQQAAEELKMSYGQFRTAMSRLLNSVVLKDDALWNSVLVPDMPDGLYALAKFNRVPLRAYLVVPAADFTTDHDENQRLSDDGLHNAICDVLERRIRNSKVAKVADLSAMYHSVYAEFTSHGMRVIASSRLFPLDC